MSMLVLLLSLASQNLPPVCSNEVSTYDIVECEGTRTAWWDTRLNSEYRRLMSVSTKQEAAAIRAAQRDWIRYRDSNCKAYAQGEGTIARIEAASCLHQMTKLRAEELARWNQAN